LLTPQNAALLIIDYQPVQAFGAIALMASARAQAPALRTLGVGLEDIEYPYPVH
jgi:hypothetical protein